MIILYAYQVASYLSMCKTAGVADNVNVRWSPWLKEDSECLDFSSVVYLYGLDELSFYIGIAHGQTVCQRWRDHLRDKTFIGRIRKLPNCDNGKIKVGELFLPDGQRYSKEKLEDIESLLIHKEWKRGGCRANEKKTKFYNAFWRGLVVVNEGDYPPLLKS